MHTHPWTEVADEHAHRHGAVLAARRSQAHPGQLSLSPVTVRDHPAPPRKLVLPSPTGSSLSVALAETGTVVAGACLRNAAAVARWLDSRLGPGAAVAVETNTSGSVPVLRGGAFTAR